MAEAPPDKEVAPLEANDMDEAFQAEVEEAMEEEPDSNFFISSMGIETVKQYNAAANLLQSWQCRMMFGDRLVSAVTLDPNVKAVRAVA